MDITTNKSKKQYMFEEQEIDLGQSESQFKNSLFGVLFVLLKDQGISIYTSCLLAIIQVIHLIYFAFHDLTGSMWEYTDVTDVLQDIFGYFTFVFYMKNAAWDVYVAVLYIFMGFTIFILLTMAYVNFAFSRRKSSFSWPVWILKNFLLLFTTILFLPFTHYFVSILDCTKDYSGTYVHTYFSEVRCWTGAHIIHICFAVISLVLFASLSLIVSLTSFEYKNDQNNPSSRVSARPNFFLNLYQLITIICLTFFSGIESQIILLAIMVTGSALLFYQFHFNCPFHDELLTKLWSILTALNLWTALMLVFAKVLEGILFEGTVIAWLIGLPFIAYIMYIRKDHRINLLLININKFKTPIEIQNQARFVQKLIQWEPNDSNAAILLKGYLEIHKKSCNKEDCPLKQNAAKNARFAKSLTPCRLNIIKKLIDI